MSETVENGSLPKGPLTDEELQALRRIIRDDDRTRFMWRTIRVWGGYTSIAIGTIYASWDIVIRMAKSALGLK